MSVSASTCENSRCFLPLPVTRLAGGRVWWRYSRATWDSRWGDDLDRLHQEGLEDDVAGDALEVDADAQQGGPQRFGVVGDLRPPGVLEPGAQALDAGLAEAAKAGQGYPAGMARLGADAEARQGAADGQEGVDQRVDGDRLAGGRVAGRK